MFKKIISAVLLFSHLSLAVGQGFDVKPVDLKTKIMTLPTKKYDLLKGEVEGMGTVGEYRAGYFPGAVMIPVNLWGATKTSGLFNVPKNTTLTTLLSYAHGPDTDAQLSNVLIKRTAENKERTIEVDLEEILQKPGTADVVLLPHDIVYIETKKSIIDTRWVTVVAFAATLLSTVLAGVLIYDTTK